jgi:hypothetical protein
MPYTLFYTTEISQGTVNYQNETVSLSIETHLHGNGIWTLSIERALQAVYDGLDATKRKDTWGLASWPRQGVTNLNAFARRSGNFSVVFELLNNRNAVIGRQTLQSGGSWGLNWSGRPTVEVNANDRKTLNFQNVNANDISDSMTIRIATVNGTAAETAARNGVLQMRAITRNEFDRNSRYRFARGVLQGLTNNAEKWKTIVIPSTIWGDPVISIGKGAFKNHVTLTGVTIPNSVISIGEEAFAIHRTEFENKGISKITIGANMTMEQDSFRYTWNYYFSYTGKWSEGVGSSFKDFYDRSGKKAGTYEYNFSWKYYTPQEAKARELYALGSAAHWNKDYASAKSYLEEALQLNPKSDDSKALLKKTNDVLKRQAKQEANK